MCFVKDVTIPDYSLIESKKSFTKTWQVKNCGNVAWGKEATLRLASGSQMGASDSVPVPNVAPGESVDISIKMMAPSQSGTHRGEWRLSLDKDTDTWVGDSVWVTILVPSDKVIAPGTTGITVKVEGKTFTLPCGSPLPPGATCTCNCVTACSCVGHCSCDNVCTCDTVCTCQGHGHYWHPN